MPTSAALGEHESLRLVSQLVIECRKRNIPARASMLASNKVYCHHMLEVIEANCPEEFFASALSIIERLGNLYSDLPPGIFKEDNARARYLYAKKQISLRQ